MPTPLTVTFEDDRSFGLTIGRQFLSRVNPDDIEILVGEYLRNPSGFLEREFGAVAVPRYRDPHVSQGSPDVNDAELNPRGPLEGRGAVGVMEGTTELRGADPAGPESTAWREFEASYAPPLSLSESEESRLTRNTMDQTVGRDLSQFDLLVQQFREDWALNLRGPAPEPGADLYTERRYILARRTAARQLEWLDRPLTDTEQQMRRPAGEREIESQAQNPESRTYDTNVRSQSQRNIDQENERLFMEACGSYLPPNQRSGS